MEAWKYFGGLDGGKNSSRISSSTSSTSLTTSPSSRAFFVQDVYDYIVEELDQNTEDNLVLSRIELEEKKEEAHIARTRGKFKKDEEREEEEEVEPRRKEP
eukprot:485427-Alexandrium_andersonii.AAC.1